MLDGDVSDYVEAESLSYHQNHIDIYSASWGPDDNGKVVDGPARLAKEAFIQGVVNGRNGRGSIFVWASGNGGVADDSCNCDGYTNSIFTLSISSATVHGTKPWYLEECSSTIATTYSSGDNTLDPKILTTDLRDSCTDGHSGTSASAPIAAGICALALEANPDLTWRDMQHIVIATANPDPLLDGDFITNGVGRKVSLKYGYGLMNANTIVKLAEKWTTVPEQHLCVLPKLEINKKISSSGMKIKVNSDGCLGKSETEIRFVEHVQAKISLTYSRRGDIRLHLKSPSGTNSTLLPARQNDVALGDFHDWPFMSVHYWGEKAKGEWVLTIENSGTLEHNSGVLRSLQLIIFGTDTDPYRPTEKALFYKTNRERRSTSTSSSARLRGCHSECSPAGCFGASPSDCVQCRNLKMGGGRQECVAQCPIGTYESKDGLCLNCAGSCESCYGPTIHDCITCAHPLVKYEDNACRHSCSRFLAPRKGVCTPCPKNCIRCHWVGEKVICDSCKVKKLLYNGNCVDSCPSGYGPVVTTCKKCPRDCSTCRGGKCYSCRDGYILKETNRCAKDTICPKGFYKASNNTYVQRLYFYFFQISLYSSPIATFHLVCPFLFIYPKPVFPP